MSQFTDGAVLVVGQHVDDHRGAPWPIGLVLRFLIRDAGLLSGAAADGALDVFGGHVLGLRVRDDRPQARVHIRIAAAGACGDRQLFDEAREDPAALGVEGALLVLDRSPLGMAGHSKTPHNL
jgi:hypothetical protein